MPLVLSLPGLLARDAYPPARSLARLIALAGAPSLEHDGIAGALAARYGVRRQTDWPLAPIRVASRGIEPGNAYWLGADPVTLTAGRDDLLLEGPVRDLASADANALIETLNTHFIDDGIEFVAPTPDAWFVRSEASPSLATHPLEHACGRSLRALLPEGDDASTWRRWQNEIQMLLFEHPVNVARERAGKPPANSVWLEFGGTMPSRDASVSIRTWTDDAAVAALAAFAGSDASPLPGTLDTIVAIPTDETLVVAFAAPIDVERVERAFASPARTALERGTIDAVTILASDRCDALEWHAQRPSRWSRWTSRFDERSLGAIVEAQRPAAHT